MKFAILVDGKAIIKTDDEDRILALSSLASKHLKKIMPKSDVIYSGNVSVNRDADMHPDRNAIIHNLREAEFPLPKNTITIDGEFERT